MEKLMMQIELTENYLNQIRNPLKNHQFLAAENSNTPNSPNKPINIVLIEKQKNTQFRYSGRRKQLKSLNLTPRMPKHQFLKQFMGNQSTKNRPH